MADLTAAAPPPTFKFESDSSGRLFGKFCAYQEYVFSLEAEHGYATTLPVLHPEEEQKSKAIRLSKMSKKPQGGTR